VKDLIDPPPRHWGVEGVRRMTDAKLAPNLPGWMVEHANRYLSNYGKTGDSYVVVASKGGAPRHPS